MEEKDLLSKMEHKEFDELASNSFYADGDNETKRGSIPQAPFYEQLDQQTIIQRISNPIIHPMSYDGKSDPAIWLLHYETIAEANHWRDEHKLNRIIGSLTGTAQDWFMNQKMQNPAMSWSILKERLINRFKPILDPIKKIDSIGQIRLKGLDISSYWEEKEKYINIVAPEMDESNRVYHLLQGLPPYLRYKVKSYMDMQTVNSSEDLRKAAMKMSDKMQQKKELNQRFRQNTSNTIAAKPKETNTNSKEPTGTKQGNDKTGVDWRKTVECFNCHQKGHYARECPNETGNDRQRK